MIKSLSRLLSSLVSNVLTGLIRTYQIALSPFLGSNCRYHPTCSAYAISALESHGPFFGSILAVKRICRCHPWADGGYDPVPEKHNALKDNERQKPRT